MNWEKNKNGSGGSNEVQQVHIIKRQDGYITQWEWVEERWATNKT